MKKTAQAARALEGELGDWYRDAIFYEVHVRAFQDSNADGVGDFPGLIQRLDHLEDLGVSVLWLLPFYSSPGRDDGYDISDYYSVNPLYGALADFRRLVKEAHRRQIRVMIELVANHTSDQHAWFQRARTARPGRRHRDYYVWSDNDQRYPLARVIFKDFERSNWTWDHEAGAYYWHRFYAHQPDLNYASPEVRREMLRVVDFWLDMGVDGFRLDAVPYLFESEGTDCENLPETHQFLRQLRQHVDLHHPGRVLLAEANQWPEMAAAYFGRGDECQMAFHFPLMPRLFMAIRMEDRFPISDILAQTPEPPEGAQWALFLRNHDELTLEMVTDEERDFMYSAYSEDPVARINLGIRRRLAPLLDNNRRRIELMNGLLFSLPGTPVIYYGDEIGMGDNIYLGDRDGVRTPMQWSPDRNAGFSQANPQRLYLPVVAGGEYHYETVNVESQSANPSSLFSWTKRLIRLRKAHPAFGRGSLELLQPDNRRVLAFVRQYQGQQLLVVANLSRFAQQAELDLSRWAGRVPVELFGQAPFAPIRDQPYPLTLGPHEFFWFELREPAGAEAREKPREALPVIRLAAAQVGDLFSGRECQKLQAVLPAYLARQRWYARKSRRLRTLGIRACLPFQGASEKVWFVIADVGYYDDTAETYLMILEAKALVPGGLGAPPALSQVALVDTPGGRFLIQEAAQDSHFDRDLLDAIAARRVIKGADGRIKALPTRGFRRMRGSLESLLDPAPQGLEQSNTSIRYGERLVLKFLRRLEGGVNPELEMGQALAEEAGFSHVPGLAGSLLYEGRDGFSATCAILHAFVPNQGNALEQMQGQLQSLVASLPEGETEIAERHQQLLAPSLEAARLLGRRVGEMHLAMLRLAAPALKPEPVTPQHLRSLHQSVRVRAVRALDLLRQRPRGLTTDLNPLVEALLARSVPLLASSRSLLSLSCDFALIRCHGDLHLGQCLFTGIDYVITDFEGEPATAAKERRRKAPALLDVAGMVRSFDYAARVPNAAGATVPEPLAARWTASVQSAFLDSYFEICQASEILPRHPEERARLLNVLVLAKACYELAYELNNRPHLAGIPMRALLALGPPEA